MNSEARIDKWLWAARVYKTRTLASDACKNGRITINGALAKPSRTVKVGDQVGVKKSPITYTFRVLQAIEKRVGAKLLPEVFENITPPEQYELLEMNRISGFIDRARGTGRPTTSSSCPEWVRKVVRSKRCVATVSTPIADCLSTPAAASSMPILPPPSPK